MEPIRLLNTGIMILLFNDAGIEPMLKQYFQKIVSGVDITYLHCFKKIVGNPSGPEAAFDFSSSIADIMSDSEKFRSFNLVLVFKFIDLTDSLIALCKTFLF